MDIELNFNEDEIIEAIYQYAQRKMRGDDLNLGPAPVADKPGRDEVKLRFTKVTYGPMETDGGVEISAVVRVRR